MTAPGRRSFRIFFKTFSAALAGFLLLALPLLWRCQTPRAQAMPAEAKNNSQPYLTENPVQMNLLLYFSDLGCYALCTVNSGSRTLNLQLLPQTAVFKSKTAWNPEQPLQSAERFFGCQVSKLAKLSNPQLANLVNACGGVAVTAESLPPVTGSAPLPGGDVNLHGTQWLRLLLQSNGTTTGGLLARARLLGGLLLQCCNAPKQAPLQQLLTPQSNLSKADLLKLQQQLSLPLQSGEFTVPAGAFIGSLYYLQ